MSELNMLEQNPDLQPLVEVIQSIMDLPDDGLTEDTVESLNGMVSGAVTAKMQKESVQAMLDAFEDQNYTKLQASEAIKNIKQEIEDLITSLNPTEQKRALLENLFGVLNNVFDTALEKYHSYSIELPMTFEEGAREPVYAHETDAAADLYAADTVVVKAHTFGNMIRTGVHIGLPEGWVAYVVPRSSIGAKTPLRLSNSVGVIDSSYRGPIGVLYDNLSDSDYTINVGDRIAQLLIMPSYQFKSKVVSSLDETERGEGGFGSTGK